MILVKVRDGAPVVLLDVEDEHLAGSIGEARRMRPEPAENHDRLGFLGEEGLSYHNNKQAIKRPSSVHPSIHPSSVHGPSIRPSFRKKLRISS